MYSTQALHKSSVNNTISESIIDQNGLSNAYEPVQGDFESGKNKISVVVTIYNEAENIARLIEKINKALQNFNYEIIIVNDGSTDNSVKEVMRTASKNTYLLNLARNCGQTAALKAGIDKASGELIVTLDGDLQNDPFDIPHMIKYYHQGNYDVVVGWRKNRQDKTLYRKVPSKIANFLIRKSTGIKVHDLGCALKVFNANLAKSLPLYGEMHRYISLLAMWQGAKMGEVEVTHHSRQFGKSKYGLSRTFNVISDMAYLIFVERYNSKPMHFFGRAALFSFLISMGLAIYLLTEKLRGNDIGTRPLVVVFTLFFLISVILFALGIITELVNKVIFNTNIDSRFRIKDTVFINSGKAR